MQWLVELFKSWFFRESEARADFAAIGEQWEKLVERVDAQYRTATEQIKVNSGRIDELQQKYEQAHRDHLQCEEERAKDRLKLLELEFALRRMQENMEGPNTPRIENE